MRPRLLHVISGLGRGGAETMLVKLLRSSLGERYRHHVLSLTRGGGYGAVIRGLGIPVSECPLKDLTRLPASLFSAVSRARSFRPDLIQAWMYHADVFSVFLKSLLPGRAPLFWNIRHSLSEYSREKPGTRLAIRLNRMFSSRARNIIFNSSLSEAQHRRFGFDRGRTRVIPNGFDTSVFRPDEESRRRIRSGLGIDDGFLLIGLVGRYHPLKDFPNFFRAVALVKAEHASPSWKCLVVGKQAAGKDVRSQAEEFGLVDRIILRDEADNIPAIMRALDILCLSSSSEAFPNVLGEAMASGVPCVSTDAGDARAIVADTGIVVPVKDHRALAEGLLRMMAMTRDERAHWGVRARRRICERYGLEAVASQYDALYRTALEKSR